MLKKEREDWKKHQELELRKHRANPLLAYCDIILGRTPDYEKGFEEEQKDMTDNMAWRDEVLERERTEIHEVWIYYTQYYSVLWKG